MYESGLPIFVYFAVRRIGALPECARNEALSFIARYDGFQKEVADERTRLGNLVVLDRLKKSWNMRYRKDNGEKK